MSTMLIFVAGLLVGWLVEWVIDWLYWRRIYADLQHKLEASQAAAVPEQSQAVEIDQLRRELRQAKARVSRYETELAEIDAVADKVAPTQTEDEKCRQQLVAAQSRIEQYQAELSQVGTIREKLAVAEAEIARLSADSSPQPGQEEAVVERIIVKDNLERINGIGPMFARRLNEAHIFTFDQLAALSPERVKEIIAPQPWQQIDPDGWITEAKALAYSAGREHQGERQRE